MTVIPFQQVLDAHRDRVWRVVVATAGPQDADDAFQEAWLVTIAHRKAIDVHRGRARRAIPVGEELPETAVHDAAPPDDTLWDAVRALPAGQRAAVTLRYAGDLRPHEVAEALRISPEAARRRIADGLKNLRQEVQTA
jgi:RNA polymerase sigma factor (sigma-70 family)